MARSQGYNDVKAWLKDNVGKNYFPGHMCPDHFINTIWRLENYMPSWRQEFMVKSLTDQEEWQKAKNWKSLKGEEQEKYAPKPTRYTSGIKERKALGKKMITAEGHARLEEIRRNWREGMSNVVVREEMEEGWAAWARKNKCCGAVEPFPVRERGRAEGGGDGEGEEVAEAPVVALYGEEGGDVGWGRDVMNIPLPPPPPEDRDSNDDNSNDGDSSGSRNEGGPPAGDGAARSTSASTRRRGRAPAGTPRRNQRRTVRAQS